jgi:basic membrane protein A
MKKTQFLIFIILFSFIMAACSEDDDASPKDDCKYKIGVVTDVGGLDDKGFNQSAWEGAKLGATKIGVSVDDCVDAKESKYTDDYYKNIKSLVDKGFDIIITSGFNLTRETREAGHLNPDVKFIGTDQEQIVDPYQAEPIWEGETDTIANVTGVIYREDIGGYLAGALAGLITTTNSVGGYYGCVVPAVNKFAIGYVNGFLRTNSAGTIINIFPDSSFPNISPDSVAQWDFGNCFTNEDWGILGATKLLNDHNADVIFAAAGGAGNGALKEACKQEKLVIGVDVDQYYSVPEVSSCIVSSAIKDLVNDVADVIEKIANDEFQGGNVYGNSLLAPFHDLEDQISDDDKKTLDDLIDDITAGTIDSCKYWTGAPEPFDTLTADIWDKNTLCPPESY